MRDLKTEQAKVQKRYRQHLRRIKDSYKLYDKEIALLMGMNIDQADYVRKMRNNEATIYTCDMVTLSKNMILEHGDASLLQELVPEGFMAYAVKGGAANGTVTDELLNITRFSGIIIEESEKDFPDTQKIIDAAKGIATQSATITSEVS